MFAIENGPFTVDLPTEMVIFQFAMLVYRKVPSNNMLIKLTVGI
jgi:hypothetical protein